MRNAYLRPPILTSAHCASAFT